MPQADHQSESQIACVQIGEFERVDRGCRRGMIVDCIVSVTRRIVGETIGAIVSKMPEQTGVYQAAAYCATELPRLRELP
jgi:hypothetical protein